MMMSCPNVHQSRDCARLMQTIDLRWYCLLAKTNLYHSSEASKELVGADLLLMSPGWQWAASSLMITPRNRPLAVVAQVEASSMPSEGKHEAGGLPRLA